MKLVKAERALQSRDKSEPGLTQVTGTVLSSRDLELNREQSLQGQGAGV